jgi:phage terminase Nu1 subunit (DNA packaging protein)
MTRNQFAALLNVARSTVSGWIRAGMPADGAGRSGKAVRIDPARALPWVVRRQSPPGSARERVAAAQADALELANARRRGELVIRAQVLDVLDRLDRELEALHDALPARCVDYIRETTSPALIRARLLEETRAVRAGYADAIERLGDDLAAADG